MSIALAILIGLFSGVAGGLFGIGGGIIIVPACIYLLAMGQKQAQGTSLVALLLPVGSLAVWNYWKSGKLDQNSIMLGLVIGAGFFVGGLFGSKITMMIDEVVLRRSFAVLLVLAAAQLFFKKG
jgi:uncharacterized membrane protein YfcA